MTHFYNKLQTLLLGVALCLCAVFASAQNNNLRVNFTSAATAPRFINICGDAETETVTIATEGTNGAARRNVQVTLNLFKGVEMVRFNAAGSSAGITLVSAANPQRPIFQLPDMTPGSATGSLQLSFAVRGTCAYTDTLAQNDALAVQDRWVFKYDLGTQTNLLETDLSTEYRDALKVPFFTLALTNNAGIAQVGQCYTRRVVVNSTGLQGFVKNMQYTNLQGAGVTVQSITVNGRPIAITKVPFFNTAGDTMVTANILGSFFTANTMGLNGGPSNGDTLFDPNETMVIMETYCLANCNKPRTSTHSANWGCDNRYCNSVSRQDVVRIGQGSVNVGFRAGGSVASQNAGYCQLGKSTITFTNQGVEIDPNTANMYDINVGIGLGDRLSTFDAGYRITAVKIAGVNIPVFTNPIVAINNNPLFRTDPDGANIGFADLDGDGFFDDLPRGQSVEVNINYEVDCGASLSNGADNCKNNFQTGFSAEIDYTDVCRQRNSVLKQSYFGPLNTNDLIENCADPDATTQGRPFNIMHTQRRNVFNFEKNCNGQEQLVVKVRLPQGIEPVMDSMRCFRYTEVFPLLSSRRAGDTLIMNFNASSTPFLNADYVINFGFRATCAANIGLSYFPVEVSYLCPPCGCSHIYYCDTLAGPQIHYATPPCVPNANYSCQKGLQTTNFEANRTTIGYTDNTYTRRFPTAQANRKVAIGCDSIQMTVKNIVGATSISDSIGMVIRYQNVTKVTSTAANDIFNFGRGVVNITHGGQNYTCTIDATKLTTRRQDSSRFLTFDLNDCLRGLGITLVQGDSVNFDGFFALNQDGAFDVQFKKIPEFRAYGFYTDGGAQFACDNYGETFRVGKMQTLFAFPSGVNMPKGCDSTNLDYRILIRNNGYTDYFGAEYRQAISMDSIIIRYDPKLIKGFVAQVTVSIPDHPIYGNNFFPIANLDSTGFYVARFDTLRNVPSYNRITNFAFDWRIKLIPNCQSLTGSSRGTNAFSFKPALYYRDRFYASVIGNGGCVNSKRDTILNGDISYTEPPMLNFTPISAPSFTPTSDTSEWTVKVCNASSKGAAGVTWFGVEPDPAFASLVNIVSMTDVTDPNRPQALQLYRYGGGNKTFAYANGLKTSIPANNFDDICNIIKIKAVIRNCGTTNLDINTGWNCVRDPDTAWSPLRYPPCAAQTLRVNNNTLAPNLDANFVDQNTSSSLLPGICDTTVLTVLLRNTDLGTVFDVKTRVTVPLEGANLIPNAVEIAYPSSAPFRPATGAIQFMESNINGKVYQYLDFSNLNAELNAHGLKGFNPSVPNDSNEFKIRFRFLNDCSFKSGTLARFSFQGRSACGTLSNFETGESLPLEIRGAQLSAPKSYEVGVNPNNRFVPGGESEIEVFAKNLVATLSDDKDNLVVKLPLGVRYKANTSRGVLPTTWIAAEPTIRNLDGGFQLLTWAQPIGLGLNDSMRLRFTVRTNDTLNCDGSNKDFSLYTTAEKNLTCSSSQTVCLAEIITTSGGEHFYSTPLSSGTVVLNAINLNDNKIVVRVGDTVRVLASGAQGYIWTNLRDSSVLSRDSALTFVPNQDSMQIRVTGASSSACVGSTILYVYRFRENTDTVPPVIFVRDTTIDCAVAFPAIVFPRVSDNRDSDVVLTYTERFDTATTCIEKLIRTWMATDRSGNVSTAVQTITRTDRTAPVITVNHPLLRNRRSGDTLSFECYETPIFAVGDATFADNCDANIQKSFVDIARQFGTCGRDGYYILMECAWRATDRCGNTAQWVVFIRMTDSEPPVFTTTIPRDTVLAAGVSLPITPRVVASDRCTDDVQVTLTQIRQDSVLIRTWTATDNCGNTAQATQRITQRSNNNGGGGTTIRDSIPPVITPVAANNSNLRNNDTLTVEGCANERYFVLADMRATDNRDPNPTLTLDSTTRTGNCIVDGFLKLKTYTFTARDSSGNVSTMRIFVKIVDRTAPTIQNVPLDTALTATQTVPTAPNNIVATDNCDPNPTLTSRESRDTTTTSVIVTRTWTARDACGNVSTRTQTLTQARSGGVVITPRDTTPPVITLRDSSSSTRIGRSTMRSGDTLEIVDCGNEPFFGLNDVLVRDNRDSFPTRTLDSTSRTGNCLTDGYLKFKTYTWRSQDSSGNRNWLILNIRLTDRTAPRIANVGRDTVLTATQTIPTAPTNIVATDNCDPNPTLTSRESRDTSATSIIVTRTWTARDACGNISTRTQTLTQARSGGVVITPRDTTPPVITLRDSSGSTRIGRSTMRSGDTLEIVDCGNEPFFGLNDVLVRDNRDSFPTRTLDSTSRTGNCLTDGYLKFKTYTWRSQDSSGNRNWLILNIRLTDRTAPRIINVGRDTVLMPTDTFPALNRGIVALDNCDPNPSLNFREQRDTTAQDTVVTRRWEARDACGNVTVKIQTITKRANQRCGGQMNSVPIQLTQTDCTVPATYCLALPLATLQGYTITDNGAAYAFALEACDSARTRLKLTTGAHQFVFRNRSNNCADTLTLQVTCNGVPTRTWRDTLAVNDTLRRCLSALNLVGNIRSVVNQCPTTSGRAVTFALDSVTKCIVVSGQRAGIDTACLMVCTDSNQCVLLTWIAVVNGTTVRRDTVRHTVTVGRVDTICLPIRGIGRPIASIINGGCTSIGDTVAMYGIVSDSCISVRGLGVGASQGCFQICDAQNNCVTIVVSVNSTPPSPNTGGRLRPVALNDEDSTRVNKSVFIYVLSNDTLNGGVTQIRVLTIPQYGTAVVEMSPEAKSSGIRYTPNKSHCGTTRPDQFYYDFCNNNYCSNIARVKVITHCNGLVIYNGFSPNGDTKNDVFIIEGLEDFPGSIVSVYNRWGTEVFKTENYQNDWGGTWNNTLLPAGTYFYRIILSNGDAYTGYLQLSR